MLVWVTRDGKNYTGNRIEFYGERPTSIRSALSHYYVGDTDGGSMEIELFKFLYGFTPRKGSCKQMELTLTEVK